MKIRILPLIAAAMIAAGIFFSSCLESEYEEIELPSISSISSFSLGTLSQTIYGGSSQGKDTIDTISYAGHPFIIDQINRRIYNTDSLPKGVDISKALVKMTADGSIFYKNENGKDTMWTSSDSLNLTKGLSLKVATYSPVYHSYRFGKPYSLTVNVHKSNPDSLVWRHFDNTTFHMPLSDQKAVYLDNNIYVFGKDGNGAKIYKISAERGNVDGSWEQINNANTENLNIHSALAYSKDVYYVAGDRLYKLGGDAKTQLGQETISSLITVSNGYMLAYRSDKTVIALDENGNKVADAGALDGNEDFSGRIFAVSYPAKHNADLWRTTVMSYNVGSEEADTTANVFSYISNEDVWIKNTPNPPAICPNLENISMIKYDGKLYAFGGKRDDKIKAFGNFYYSNNNGFDWRTEPNKHMKFEEKMTDRYNDKPYSCVVETNNEGQESFIWFVWHDGKITRGHLNKFAPKN